LPPAPPSVLLHSGRAIEGTADRFCVPPACPSRSAGALDCTGLGHCALSASFRFGKGPVVFTEMRGRFPAHHSDGFDGPSSSHEEEDDATANFPNSSSGIPQSFDSCRVGPRRCCRSM